MMMDKPQAANTNGKWLWLLCAPAVWLLDYLTKIWAIDALKIPGRSIELIAGWLDLSYVENTGIAFGMLDSLETSWKPVLLSLLGLAAMIAILLYFWKTPPQRRLLLLGLAITCGGIPGNIYDRLFRGYVVDFIEFHIHDSFYWPNFNVADSAISVGIALLIIDAFRHPDMLKPAADKERAGK